ncbi:MAG: hypothetical protein WBG73_07590 [Coleofasciculaceae cyanobacterium]
MHDLLKAELKAQDVPVDIFFANDARWVIEGARGRAKVDNDRRPRLVATLRNSPYTDMQFIAGIDYFGSSSWADVQMMLIVQPEEIKLLPKPTAPRESDTSPILPDGALWLLVLIAGGLMFTGNGALQLLGCIGVGGVIYLTIKSNRDVTESKKDYALQLSLYQQRLDEWETEKEQLALEREELIKNRLSRSFKTDDLRVFHTVMTRSIARIISDKFLKQGAAIKESIENNDVQNAVSNTKNIFDEF